MTLDELNELDFQDIANWPSAAKIVLVLLACVAIGVGSYFLFIEDSFKKLEQEQQTEIELRQKFETKALMVSNLESHRAQLSELEHMLEDLLSQLPTRTEIAGLLDALTHIGQDNGLKFNSISWQPVVEREFSLEVPIKIDLTGSYDQLGHFTADVAALPRIVMLENFVVVHEDTDQLRVNVLAKTYQYLEKKEAK